MTKDTWNERLKRALEARGYSQVELASAVGVSEAAVSDWVGGVTKTLKAPNAAKVEAFLNLPPRYLIEGIGGLEMLSLTANSRPVNAVADPASDQEIEQMMLALNPAELMAVMEPFRDQLTDREKMDLAQFWLEKPRADG